MFTNDARQAERTGKYGTHRQEHLQSIVTQFQDPTQTLQTKTKLLSNLANFAYDPYNSSFLRRLNVLELFLDHLDHPTFALSSAAGLCNAAADPDNARSIAAAGGVAALLECLSASSGEGSAVVVYAVAGLFYLCEGCGDGVVEEVRAAEVVEVVERLAVTGEGSAVRNVSRVLLDKYLRPRI